MDENVTLFKGADEPPLTQAFRLLIEARNLMNSVKNKEVFNPRMLYLLDTAVEFVYEAQGCLENIPGVVP